MAATESVPNYLQFIQSFSNFLSANYQRLKENYSFPIDTIKDLEQVRTRTSTNDVIVVFSLAIILTIGRYLATEFLFKPFARICRMSDKEVVKYPESAWKFLFYLSTFSLTLYITFGQTCCQYFYQPSLIWDNYSMNDVVPNNMHILYLIEISFYIHSIYAVVCLDEWRKDSLVMFIHHIITFLLLSLSFVIKGHRVGVLVLLLHDGCDVIMEGTKCVLNFKSIGGLFGKVMDILSAIGFISFVISWFICRLYWFPLKAIYSCSEYLTKHEIKSPFVLVLYSMLWIILAMNIYWFTFIVKLLINILTGKSSKLEDTREYSQKQEKNVKYQRERNGVQKKQKRK